MTKRFWNPIDPSSRKSLDAYNLQLKCIKVPADGSSEPISLQGNSNHLKGKQLVILFEACKGQSESGEQCYSTHRIKESMRGKSILILAN